MRSRHGSRAGLGGAVAMVLGVLALLALPGLAAAKDRNHDHISDRWEKRHHLSLRVNQAARDQDRDHLNNLGEFKAGDNPRDEDTDNDGVMDGEENAGTITAYDTETGKLTISLFGGDTVSGIVTENTNPLRPREQPWPGRGRERRLRSLGLKPARGQLRPLRPGR